MKTYSTIIRPILTEKSSMLQNGGQYSFEVRRDATKIDIKNAVKEIYGADVDKVTISILPKKTRLVGRGREITKRQVTKKAIVTLKAKKTIDPLKVKETKK
ncbi:50S ribosomal protein L23 [Candidatus Peregrinibacteria bacterium CG10_big_fil_rev_8_21_14_0_10_36_19]|nr:MAG: 50S ribosomal protein L23 [Candidatus Peregrinibacteria bacterium CG10_big_fil_rev_8_21_14_0_10_36_19]